MKLTRHEMVLLASVLAALLVGTMVKRYRDTHPPANPVPASVRGR
jgi:hypothetical protein